MQKRLSRGLPALSQKNYLVDKSSFRSCVSRCAEDILAKPLGERESTDGFGAQ